MLDCVAIIVDVNLVLCGAFIACVDGCDAAAAAAAAAKL
jgi:hypothetical protein